MIVRNRTFYHVNKYLDWKEGQEFLIGDEMSPQYMSLMSRSAIFAFGDDPKNAYPLSAVAAGFMEHKETGRAPQFFPPNFDFKKGKVFGATVQGFNDFVLITRELIYEEVRKAHFSTKPSRTGAFHLIPDGREAAQFWLPKISSPEHKLYKLEVTGTAHVGSLEFLGVESVSPFQLRTDAYKYWMGAEKESESNEIMFQGIVKVLSVKDIGK